MAGKSVAKTESDLQVDTVETKPKGGKKPAAPKKVVDLTKVTPAELAKMKKEYARYRLEVLTGKQSNTASLRMQRKQIARAMTYLNNKAND
ncbi:50S ribosomal protein L29 [Candidatus Dojkabacteria bacterium]|uniref:Large ribosomal subunit protein uL29 n=1 Tax=Candidatus Dojkabacteria bacterium TaxID=2099670 RepID=A0A955I5C5_9BACT|nr:50S ribosomal protein L29 [Candidatus Dojkabacteria bacterium]